MCALSAKEIGYYLEDHFIESVTENWRYFRFSLRKYIQGRKSLAVRTWRNVYLLKIKAKSFRDGSKHI